MKFLLFGRSRSGTTITFKILQKHSEIKIVNQTRQFLKDDFEGGEKTGTPTMERLERLARDDEFKFIHIYRDGRDSVSSGMRMNKVFGPKYRPWKDMNPRINSKDWADIIFRWQKAKQFIPEERRIDIKFEDYLKNPGKNSSLIAELLVIEKTQLINIERKLIKPSATHVGYYTECVPNWRNTFHPDALRALKFLGYTD